MRSFIVRESDRSSVYYSQSWTIGSDVQTPTNGQEEKKPKERRDNVLFCTSGQRCHGFKSNKKRFLKQIAKFAIDHENCRVGATSCYLYVADDYRIPNAGIARQTPFVPS